MPLYLSATRIRQSCWPVAPSKAASTSSSPSENIVTARPPDTATPEYPEPRRARQRTSGAPGPAPNRLPGLALPSWLGPRRPGHSSAAAGAAHTIASNAAIKGSRAWPGLSAMGRSFGRNENSNSVFPYCRNRPAPANWFRSRRRRTARPGARPHSPCASAGVPVHLLAECSTGLGGTWRAYIRGPVTAGHRCGSERASFAASTAVAFVLDA